MIIYFILRTTGRDTLFYQCLGVIKGDICVCFELL